MTNKTEDLIAQISAQGARPPMRHPAVYALAWLGFSAVWIGGFLAWAGLRPDIADKLGQAVYLAELVALVALAVSAAAAAATLSRPGAAGPRTWAPLALLAAWALLAYFGSIGVMGWDAMCAAGSAMALDCPWHIFLFSAPPALMAFSFMRLGAPTRPLMAGAMGTLAATALAYGAMRVMEPTDSAAHLLIWHAAPVAALCFTGVLAGRWALRW